jgi:hypothetical protein
MPQEPIKCPVVRSVDYKVVCNIRGHKMLSALQKKNGLLPQLHLATYIVVLPLNVMAEWTALLLHVSEA